MEQTGEKIKRSGILFLRLPFHIVLAEIGLGINIKTIFIFAVDQSFCFLERWSNAGFQQVKKGCLERFAKQCVSEMFYNVPKNVIR